MVTKLKSVLKSPQLLLALKAAAFGIGLNFLPAALFVPLAILLYAIPFFRTIELTRPFFVLLVVSLLALRTVNRWDYSLFLIVYFAFLFYLILGIKDLVVIKRAGWYRFLNLALVHMILLLFFYYNQEFFLIKLLIVFCALLFLLKACLPMPTGRQAVGKELLKNRLAVWLIAFLMAQGIWVIGLLPIGFINAANFGLLAYFIMLDLAEYQLSGPAYRQAGYLPRRRILTDTTIFVLLALLIFATSRWGI